MSALMPGAEGETPNGARHRFGWKHDGFRGFRVRQMIVVAEQRGAAGFTMLMRHKCRAPLVAFGEAGEEVFEGQNLGGRGGILVGVFPNDGSKMSFENALGAQERVGGVHGRFQFKALDELVVGNFRGTIDDGVDEANPEEFPNIAAAWLFGGW